MNEQMTLLQIVRHLEELRRNQVVILAAILSLKHDLGSRSDLGTFIDQATHNFVYLAQRIDDARAGSPPAPDR
jgi:hypothetical protein